MASSFTFPHLPKVGRWALCSTYPPTCRKEQKPQKIFGLCFVLSAYATFKSNPSTNNHDHLLLLSNLSNLKEALTQKDTFWNYFKKI